MLRSPSFQRSSLLVIGTALATVAVTGCGGAAGGSAGGGAVPDGIVYTEATTDPTSFDPALARAGDDYVVDSLLYDTVLARDDDGSLIPGLAESWEATSASAYVFTIREGATCADGTEITPTVVANSLEYFGGDESHVFAPLVFGGGKATITADDQGGTVRIETAEPYANLPQGLTIPQSGIVCPAGLADKPGLAAGKVEGAFSGPYTLHEAKPGVSYTYALREDYDAWPELSDPLKGEPAAKLVYSLATDEATSANKLLNGDLHLANIGGEALARFESGDFNEESSVIANVYVMFNQRPGQFFAGNAEARQAVAQAIDRDAFNKVFSGGRNELFDTIVPSSYDCALDDDSLIESHDPQAAAEVLKGAKIKLVASSAFGDDGKGAEYLRQVLDDAGAEVDLTKVDNATWATETQKSGGDWDMTIMGDINAAKIISASLDRVLGPALEDGGRNIPGVNNPVGSKALQQGLVETDPEARCGYYEDAQRALLENDDVVPLTGIIWSTISAPAVEVRAPGGALSYRTVRIVE